MEGGLKTSLSFFVEIIALQIVTAIIAPSSKLSTEAPYIYMRQVL